MPLALAAAAVRVMRSADAQAAVARATPLGRATAADAPAVAAPGSVRARGGAGTAADATTDPADRLVDDLRAAIAQQRAVLLDYATSTGVSTTVHVRPLRLARGYLTGLDLLTEAIETYSLPRIRSVHRIDAVD